MVSLTGAVVFNRVAKYIQIYQLKIKCKFCLLPFAFCPVRKCCVRYNFFLL